MYHYLYLISILICAINATELTDTQDDHNQSLNNYELSSNDTSAQNVIDLLQTIQSNSTQSLNDQNSNGLSTNLTSSGIPILFNQYQYDSPVYQEPRSSKEQASTTLSSSSSSQSTLLDSSGTNQNYQTKEYTGFDDNQKMYIEQQIEQDSKYLPEIFDMPQPAQIIEPSVETINQISQINNDFGVKTNKVNRPVQNSIRTPAIVNKLNRYPVKGTSSSVKMANNQEWNVIDKNSQTGFIRVNPNANLGTTKISSSSNYQSNSNVDDGFTNLDQQYDLTKINKVKITNQQPSNYNRPIEGSTQIISANYQNSFQPVQQQIITSNIPQSSIKQQTSSQYNVPNYQQNNYQQQQQQQINYSKKPPCSKSSTRQKPERFYFGWKQNQLQQQIPQQQRQKYTVNNAMDYIQQQKIYPNYQPNQNQNKHFGMPNHYDQQPNQFNRVRKCCIVKLVPKQQSGFNKGGFGNQSPFSSSNIMQFNPFQTGMFGGLGGGMINKLENKKSKIKNLIKAPFMLVNDIKHKALGNNNNQIRGQNFNYYPIQQQQQQSYSTKGAPFSQGGYGY